MLDELRKKINSIDESIIKLISERAEVAQDIACAKSSDNSPLYRPAREQEVYRKIKEINPGPLDNSSLQNIYREIMSATLKIEGNLRVAYLGPAGSFTHQAAIKKFGSSVSLIAARNIEEVFDVVQKKEVKYGVVPLENSIEGIVNATLDSLISYELTIYAEIKESVHHNLLSHCEDLTSITEVLTHVQAYGQCKKWIIRNLPHAIWKETSSTSRAVQIINERKGENIAAIGSSAASIEYEVPMVSTNIADHQRNFTRFVVVGYDKSQPSNNDRTSIIFTLPHKPGTLYSILQPIFESKLNLTTIESRPNKSELWSYIFYIELEGHQQDKAISDIINRITEIATSCRVLGSYPSDLTAVN